MAGNAIVTYCGVPYTGGWFSYVYPGPIEGTHWLGCPTFVAAPQALHRT